MGYVTIVSLSLEDDNLGLNCGDFSQRLSSLSISGLPTYIFAQKRLSVALIASHTHCKKINNSESETASTVNSSPVACITTYVCMYSLVS